MPIMASKFAACGAAGTGFCSCAFHLALEDFKKNSNLSAEELQSFEGTRLHQLRSAIGRIQKDQESKRRLRYMKRLEPFLQTMEQYGKVVEVFVNASDIVAYLWGPMKFLLITASSYTEALDSLMDAYQAIWEELPLLEAYQPLIESRPDLKTVLVWVYQDILDFHREALRYFRHRVWKQLFQSAWRGFGFKIKAIKENMARHKRLLAEGVGAMEIENSGKIRQELRLEFEARRRVETDRRRDEVVRWLSPYPTREILGRHRKARSICPDSGDWLLKTPKFDGWISPQYCTNPLLWITGILGAGKSVLASLIIEETQNLLLGATDPCSSDPSVAYFFCHQGETESNTFLAVARGILAQLMTQNTHLLPHIYEQRSLSGEVVLSSGDLARSLLEAVLGCCKNTYIVIDGLDSCSRRDRKEIVQVFRGIIESLPPTETDAIRCVFVSQDDGVARKDLSDIPTIRITPDDNRRDIERYSVAKKKTLEARFGSLDSTGVDVVKVVTAKAQGMFLYAELAFANLLSCALVPDLVRELKSIPKGLDEAYARIVDRLLSSTDVRPSECLSILGWLACAKRPLKWYELRGAVSIDIEGQTIRQENQMLLGARLWELCGPLATIRQDQTLEFIHPTAKEYLLKHKLAETDIQLELFILSVSYLNLPGIRHDASPDRMKALLIAGYYGFLDYSMTSWSLHLQDTCRHKDCENSVEKLAEELDVFLDCHWTHSEDLSDIIVTKTVQETLSLFKKHKFYDKLCLAFAAAKKQLSIYGQGPLEHEPLDLSTLGKLIRQTLETFAITALPSEQRTALQDAYGPNWFKCERPNCVYFHQGFPNAQQRDDHTARHERPFICIEPTCFAATMGYPTKKALKKHLLEDHGVDLTGDLEFPEPPTIASNAAKAPSNFACELCSKTFTRNHNLKIHAQTHQREKPYSCDVCGQGFVRAHDRKRHQGLHSGEKKYVCSGELKDGKTWGCGRNFARQDKLTEHYRNKAGKKCLQPLAAEEAKADGMRGAGGKELDVAELLKCHFLLDPERFRPFQGVPVSSLFPSPAVLGVEGREDGEVEGA
ncbi:hypothetical protein B0T26DRAFT_682391 [Lasiosphaeria miniovina]|uniref:C2H2-type domain-containing protein n=1 Tax=Lasiosphaeria miniovina TaxID=1954250 RepID=A0AA40BEV2_9PEZI|nr:uncharacterized protein B0T26DRAFT_682391 [Lasiosphaeria miniovina]KAK0732942.1 hypothetical protein B0T26DRAFT_682391 [Lasiosphaeria miniovina]